MTNVEKLLDAAEDISEIIDRYKKILKIALGALEDLKLSHEHNESNADYRSLGDHYGWCSKCSTRVESDKDYARAALKEINEIAGKEWKYVNIKVYL